MRLSPGCNCCGITCQIIDDDFNGRDTYPVDADDDELYTDATDAWDIKEASPTDRYIECASSSERSDILLVSKAAAHECLQITIDIRKLDSGDQFDIIFHYVDVDNYNYARVARTGTTSWELRLVERDSGLNTEIDSVQWSQAESYTSVNVWVSGVTAHHNTEFWCHASIPSAIVDLARVSAVFPGGGTDVASVGIDCSNAGTVQLSAIRAYHKSCGINSAIDSLDDSGCPFGGSGSRDFTLCTPATFEDLPLTATIQNIQMPTSPPCCSSGWGSYLCTRFDGATWTGGTSNGITYGHGWTRTAQTNTLVTHPCVGWLRFVPQFTIGQSGTSGIIIEASFAGNRWTYEQASGFRPANCNLSGQTFTLNWAQTLLPVGCTMQTVHSLDVAFT